ncbi:MAG: exonuclease SbcCD subunit D [Candidatus Bathyarchaeia archaeon]
MVRFAHIADTHLGFRQYNLDEREQDVYDVMDEIVDKLLEERVDIIIHSGDLFDSSRPTAQAYYAFKRFLTRLNGKIKVFSILGDHDTPKRKGMPPQKLFEGRIHILGLNGGEYQVIHFNSQDVLVAGISYIGHRYKEFLIEELKKLDSIAIKYPLSILALHQAVEKFFMFEGAFEIKMNELPKNFRYYAMGHLHDRIQVPFLNGKLAYAGSTEIFRSNEVDEWKKHGKGFYIVDLNNNDISVKEVNLESIRPQLKVKINYANFDQELKKLENSLEGYRKLPIAHVIVEGKEIDRQRVQHILNETLSGKVLHFRSQIVEEFEKKLFELKSGNININVLLKEYFKDEKIAEFGFELFKVLRLGDIEEAKKIANEYFKEMEKCY